MSDETKVCAFCQEPERAYVPMIAGATAFICRNCIWLCSDILEEEKLRRTKAPGQLIDGKVERPEPLQGSNGEAVMSQETSEWGPRFAGPRCIRHQEDVCPSCLSYALGDFRELARELATELAGQFSLDEEWCGQCNQGKGRKRCSWERALQRAREAGLLE